MLVKLPRRMNAAGIYGPLAAMFNTDGTPRSPGFEIDFSDLNFIDPVGVATLANAIEAARGRGSHVSFAIPPGLSRAVSYLDDSGFFALYGGRVMQQGASLRDTTVPLQRIAHSQSHYWLESRFLGWLASRLHLSPASLASIHGCMKEIFNNIKDHSGEEIGCIYMQHFPNINEIAIAVSDFGVGIPNAIRRAYPGMDDAAAIQHASKDGITSRSTRGNRGVGLDLLISVVVSKNRGKVHIHSGKGKLSCKIVGGNENRVPWSAPSFYPGTLVEIRLRTDTIQPDEVEREALEW